MKMINIFFLVIVITLISIGGFLFLVKEGEFEKTSHSSMRKEGLVKNNSLFLGYGMKWDGIGTPTIEKIQFYKEDGSLLSKREDEIVITPYIDTSKEIGSMYEEHLLEEGYMDHLLNVRGYKVTDHFHMVLKVEIGQNTDFQDIGKIRIMYKKFGLTKFQEISLEEGIVSGK
ncbi:hypothetical protein [Mangrovibacillus cuniculi]|uniref:Uncharacterized protein n=1 Tax=Mangrovibacillus cuniculi TaxID=2593652 RepID=A0A7S8C9K2_9BACI|nr:hypothetical protein [Mangrovibacillus cuniculi]QPC45867.1 hypothetical protein G8O30_02285 [Mangrovibacillus cuniculi]